MLTRDERLRPGLLLQPPVLPALFLSYSVALFYLARTMIPSIMALAPVALLSLFTSSTQGASLQHRATTCNGHSEVTPFASMLFDN